MPDRAHPSSDAVTISYEQVEQAAKAAGLIVMGALHPRVTDAKQLDGGTLLLLGAGADFWPTLKTSDEWQSDDPVDRWSLRVIGQMAQDLSAQAHFPFGGPPYAPFIDWALKSGRTFSSPVGALVHDEVGMMISFRGALQFEHEFPIPTPKGASPCTTCAAPCTQTCPVNALNSQSFYDVAACHDHLSTDQGQTCMTGGCLARLSCPLSAGAGRDPEQSAHHMRAFHPS
ncbi:ferredoxin [Ruegeria sp. R14_0]|uniref:ferredoxin n=1 Tax=Ruegeria sp. R14_0 TaxID=2821100 RepID=UPI001ADC3929|nr:ferredoxin [Ruegeria sp. R14_0]MBO9448386.1 ferredoxin [Ruegeria sp. R14_0]